MTVVVDTSFVVALLHDDDELHEEASAWLRTCDEDLWTSPLTLAEINYWTAKTGASAAFWEDLDAGAYHVRWWADALHETIAIARTRPEVGLADASLVAVAHRLETDRIATFDLRHFRSLTTVSGEPFVVLPADA
jgi:predicted nucleic acid-binding protein